MKHEDQKTVESGAKPVSKYPHIKTGHPIHNLATKLHALVSEHHPDTSLTVDHFIDTICNDGDAVEGTHDALN